MGKVPAVCDAPPLVMPVEGVEEATEQQLVAPPLAASETPQGQIYGSHLALRFASPANSLLLDTPSIKVKCIHVKRIYSRKTSLGAIHL